MRSDSGLIPGQRFNPYRMFHGIFIPEGLVRSKAVSAGAKLVWGRLARYAGEDGKCYPTMRTLGAEIGVGERQAQKYIAELRKLELIRRVKRFAKHAQLSNGYEFLWHSMFKKTVTNHSGIAERVAVRAESRYLARSWLTRTL